MKWRHSLSARLLGLFLLIALLLSLVVKLGFEFGVRDHWRELAQPHLAEYLGHLLKDIGDPPRIDRAAALTRRLPLDIVIQDGAEVWSSSGEVPNMARYRFHPVDLNDERAVEVGWWRGTFLVRTQVGGARVIIIPGESERYPRAPWAGLVTIAGVLAVLLFFFYILHRLFRPIRRIAGSLALFGRGELDGRIRLQRQDELGELACSVDRMADDIQRMLEAKRQLLLAISHELRSPLTRARVNVELLAPSDRRDDLARDLTEIETLLNELLESERLSGRHAALNLSAVDAMALIETVIQRRYADQSITLRLAGEGTFISLDKARIKLLLRNLLDNALRHTPAAAPPPGISSGYRDNSWWLRVQDNGPGIAAEHLPHVLEPFYRVDPARRRETGGYGLGLYLCRMIAEAHGGTLSVTSEAGAGTSIDLLVPLPSKEY